MLRSIELFNFFSDVREIIGGYGSGLKLVPLKGDREITLGTYEAPVQEALIGNTSPGEVVYDIGANVGYFTMLAARRVGADGQVYAFEPVPSNAAAIARSARLNAFETVTVFDRAVGAVGGVAELNLARHIGGAMLASIGAPPDQCGSVEVEVVALDEFIGAMGLRPPSLVKIDVEGAELDVLRGMTKTLKQHSPAMIIELDDAVEDGLLKKAGELADLLASLSYETTVLSPSYPGAGWSVAHFLAKRRDIHR